MEDFSNILWVVIILGAMIFNSVSKARKAREKNENPSPRHGEAWPSIPWNDDELPADQASRPMKSVMQDTARKAGIPERQVPSAMPETRSNREAPVPDEKRTFPRRLNLPDKELSTIWEKEFPTSGNNRPTLRRSTLPPSEGGFMPAWAGESAAPDRKVPESGGRGVAEGSPGRFSGSRESGRESARDFPRNSRPETIQGSIFGEFPDECQSLEVIPDEEYLPGLDTSETMISGRRLDSKGGMAPSGKGGSKGPKTTRNDPSKPNNPSNGIRNRARNSEEESLAEIVEEFDLRRAVIYSEILKPKFEEQAW